MRQSLLRNRAGVSEAFLNLDFISSVWVETSQSNKDYFNRLENEILLNGFAKELLILV